MKNKPTLHSLTARELATALAALRFFQRTSPTYGTTPETDIATDGGTLVPLTVPEIDALCDKLNLDGLPDTYNQHAEFLDACRELKLFGGGGGYQPEAKAKRAFNALTR